MHFEGSPIGEPANIHLSSAWLRHGPFGMWLVHALSPRTIVELGTYHGYSYFCFCQAVAEAGFDTRCFAVDTWQGDEHGGFYGESIFDDVKRHNAPYENFSTLLRKIFSDATSDIEDGTVDLLHVDGRHFYEDVKEDFESWIPKLSQRAVVLFHDTEVRDRGFGVWRFWNEISGHRPSINFPYQHGLGVLFWGRNIAPGLKSLVSMLDDSRQINQVIRMFELKGESVASAAALFRAGKAEAAAETALLRAIKAEAAAETALLRAAKAEEDLQVAMASLNEVKQHLLYRSKNQIPLKLFRRWLS